MDLNVYETWEDEEIYELLRNSDELDDKKFRSLMKEAVKRIFFDFTMKQDSFYDPF